MNLKGKKDSEFIGGLQALREREKETVAEILHHLLEVERRSLHLEKWLFISP
jgi:hypothetical protein